MNLENINQEVNHGVLEKYSIFEVTKLSKYLALVLFIIMPFIGGYIGYIYAPEKIIEVEKIVFLRNESDKKEDLLEGWEYYTDNDLEIEFQYPADFYIGKHQDALNISRDEAFIEFGALAPGQTPKDLITISFYETEMSPEEYYEIDALGKKNALKISDTFYFSKRVFKTSYTGLDGQIKIYMSSYIPKGQGMIIVSFVFDEIDDKKNEKIFRTLVEHLNIK